MAMTAKTRIGLLAAVLGMAASAPARPADDSLESRLTPLIQAHKGKVAVAVKNLETGESFAYHGDKPMGTASLIKFPIMVEAYRQAAEKKVDLDKTVTLKKGDKVPGSGILTAHFSEGAKFPLRDAVHLMIVYSDNTATNLVLDKTGIAPVGERMAVWGAPNTKVHAKVFRRDTSIAPERSKKYGLGSTTAREMVLLLEKVHKGELVNPDACKQMLDHMKKCDDKDKIRKFLPASVVVANKSGSVDDVKTDTGIMYLPGGPVAICVLTSRNEDKRYAPDNAGGVLIGKIAEQVYQYFKKETKH
jgi:beta-lactamase class A